MTLQETIDIGERIQRGDLAAFREFYSYYFQHVLGVAEKAIEDDPALAKKAAIVVFLSLWRCRKHFRFDDAQEELALLAFYQGTIGRKEISASPITDLYLKFAPGVSRQVLEELGVLASIPAEGIVDRAVLKELLDKNPLEMGRIPSGAPSSSKSGLFICFAVYYLESTYRYASTLLGPGPSAKNVTLEAFMSLYVSWSDDHSIESMKSFLYSSVLHNAESFARYREKYPEAGTFRLTQALLFKMPAKVFSRMEEALSKIIPEIN